MSILYIRHPSKAVADAATAALPCRFALASNSGAVEREAWSTLPGLADAIRHATRVVLLLAACDVSLLRVKVPPLSGVRLKTALPNLVEDQLLSDPAACVFAVDASQDGMRTVAIVGRAWLEQLSATLTALGARQLAVLPAQLCLPYQPAALVADVTEYGTNTEIAWRWSEHQGGGFCLDTDAGNAAHAAIDALRMLALHAAPQTALILHVAPASVAAYQQAAAAGVAAAGQPELQQLPPLQIVAADWASCVAAAKTVTLDLMAGLRASTGSQLRWRPWRWPAALALLALLVNVVGLNVSAMQMRREADGLQNGMLQTFRTAFPKERVIIDPLAQMQQKIGAIRQGAGQAEPDDFLALASAFGNAWSDVQKTPSAHQAPTVIVAFEYRERGLLVRIKPVDALAADSIRSALAAQQLVLTEQDSGVWQIRRAR